MPSFAVRHPYLIIVFCLFVIVLGMTSLLQMPVDMFPPIQIPVVLLGNVTDFARNNICLKASTVLMSGLGIPARSETPNGVRAKFISVPAAILPSATNSSSPSLDMITMSAGTPRRSWAPMALGPPPWDCPRTVVTVMPVVFSNSGIIS